MPLDDPITAYVHWATESVTALRPWLGGDDVDRLVRTPTYWAALTMPTGTMQGARLVGEEMMARREELQRVLTSLEEFTQRFEDAQSSALVVPDTNVLLEHPQALDNTDWHELARGHAAPMDDLRVVLPLLVVDELDDAKRNNRTKSRARQSLKMVYGYFGQNRASTLLRERSTDGGRVELELLIESPGHARLSRADDELVSVATRLQDFVERPVILMTYDTGCALRGVSGGLRVAHLSHRDDS